MKAILRWLSIAAAFALAIVPAASVSGAPSARHTHRSPSHRASRAKSHSRSTHASLRTVRYSREASSSSASSKSKSTKKKKRTRRSRRRSTRMRLPKAPTPARISEIQSALARGGYYEADPNGKWDAKTVAAVRRFQSDNNLDATGKLDAPTLQKLGLGSDIAGVSAPKPIVPASCCDAPAPADPPTPSAPSKQAPSGNSAPAGHAATSSPKSSPGSNSSTGSGATSRSGAAAADPQH
jgi:hypothetical protein